MTPRRCSPWSAVALALAVAASTLGACPASHAPGLRDADYPGTLRDPGDTPGDWSTRQRIAARFGDDEHSFEAVVQKRGAALTIVGLTPFGTKAFALEQQGADVAFRQFIPGDLPVPPRFILLDVHRVLLDWAPPPPGGEGEGDRTLDVDGERITERWRGGALMERRFERIAGAPPGAIVVDYGPGLRRGAPPPTISLANGWFGYVLTIVPLTFRAAPPPEAPAPSPDGASASP